MMARRDAEDADRSESLSVADLLRAAGREDILTNRRRRRGDDVSSAPPAPSRPGQIEQTDMGSPPDRDELTSEQPIDEPDRSQRTATQGPVAQMAQLARTEALAKLAHREPSWFTLAEFSEPIRPAEISSPPETALPLAVVRAAVESAEMVRPHPGPVVVAVTETDLGQTARTGQTAVQAPVSQDQSAVAEPDELSEDSDARTHGVVVQWLLVVGELVLAVGLGVALSYVFRLLWDVAPYVAAVSAPVAVCALVGNVGWVRKRLGLGALPLWLLLVILFVAMLLVVLPAAWILSGQ